MEESKKKTNTCWEWTAAKDRDGYGIIRGDNKHRALKAHRVSLELEGLKIPKGMCVDHMCRNRSCVNPSHLRIVTRTVNVLENSNSLAAKFKARTHCKRGHEYTEKNLFKNQLPIRACKTCSKIEGKLRAVRGN